MFNLQLKKNLKELDKQISTELEKLKTCEDDDQKELIISRIDDLTKLRDLMSKNKVDDSVKKELINGVFNIGSMLMVLRYEKVDVIVSKAFGMIGKKNI